MFWLGIEDMRRRVSDYPPELGTVNLFVSIMALNIALSVAVFVFNMVRSWARGPRGGGRTRGAAQTLEWQVASPPPIENFEHIPTVTAPPYEYGNGEPVPGRAAGARPTEAATMTAGVATGHGGQVGFVAEAGHGTDAAAARNRVLLGVKLGILSEIMLFGGLFAAYFVIRSDSRWLATARPGAPRAPHARAEHAPPGHQQRHPPVGGAGHRPAATCGPCAVPVGDHPARRRRSSAIQAYEFATNGFGLGRRRSSGRPSTS